jgi:AcrR family transcriptional regulator
MPEVADGAEAPGKRPLGRPRLTIDPDDVADAVAELFVEGGEQSVNIAAAADKLNVSRATLYRTFPTKQDLVGVLFERSTGELTESAKSVVGSDLSPRDKLEELIRLEIEAAVRMRGYMPVFFGGGGLPADVYARWRTFSRNYEKLWVGVVSDAMDVGSLTKADPVATARLLLGQCLWVSRWYRPNGKYTTATITDAAMALLPPRT